MMHNVILPPDLVLHYVALVRLPLARLLYGSRGGVLYDSVELSKEPA